MLRATGTKGCAPGQTPAGPRVWNDKTDMKNIEYDIDGQRFHALTAGNPDSPMILFLHGFPEYSGAWSEVIARLADRFYCVAPDQRGYGRSWRPEAVAQYHARHLVDDALATIARFNARGGKIVLVGHDWGASIAYATAIRRPDVVARLVVFNGVHPVPFQTALAAGGGQSAASEYITWMRTPGAAKALAANNFARLFSFFSKGMDMSWLTPERRADYVAAWRDEAGVRAMVNWYRASPLMVAQPGQPIAKADLPDWSAARLRITMPHLLVWGQKDSALLAQSRAGLGDWCDDLRVTEVADCDHWILHQRPDFAAEAIGEFLQDWA